MNKLQKLAGFPVLSFLICFILVALTLLSSQQKAIAGNSTEVLVPKETIEFTGTIIEDEDISAVGVLDSYLLIGADEGNQIQVLKPNPDHSTYQVVENIPLPVPNAEEEEIDIEGIAIAKNKVYVVGSHSLNRKTVKDKKTYQENLERLATVNKDKNRQNIFCLKLNPETGKLDSDIKQESLRKILAQDPILARFTKIPSKENGVDIEGIAAKDKHLYLGFRGPVLRGNYVPVMVVKFKDLDHDNNYELRYVNLKGNGIRDLVAVDDGFLILAGAVGDGISPYQIYFWDGKDDLPGSDKTSAKLKLLGEVPATQGAKAEGLTVIEKTNSGYKILVVYDGIAKGNPTLFEVTN